MDTLTPTQPAPAPLIAADRCDRCGAQAFLRATLPSGFELLFCGHHAQALRDSLLLEGATLHDETGALRRRRSDAA